MSEHMSRNEYVFGEAVARGQIGVAWVTRKHHLEEAGAAHVALDELIYVPHAEGPVRHSHRETVNGDLHHEGIGDCLEFDWMKTESRFGRKLFDALRITLPVLCHRKF